MNRYHHDETPAREPARKATVGQVVGRRRFLGMLGLGGGTLAVAGAGGLTWRAVDTGVFAAGTGPAYAAWDHWNPPERGVLNLVRAGVLAASAHNTQPWLFRVGQRQIDLYADLTRGLGSMDLLRREMYLSVGCALENLVLAGPPNGLRPAVAVMPDPSQPSHVARVRLTATHAQRPPLFAAIPHRHTNRGAYHSDRPLAPDVPDALTSLLDVDTTGLVWFTAAPDKDNFGELTVHAVPAQVQAWNQPAAPSGNPRVVH